MKELIIGLLFVMGANILFGATKNSLLEGFKFKVFLKGLIKSILIALGMTLIYFAGYYNPNIIAINISGINMNLMQGIEAILIAGIIAYGYKALINAAGLLKINMNMKESGIPLEDTFEKLYYEENPKIEEKVEEDEVTISR